MHRVDTLGNVNGLFADGNPAIGQIATLLQSAWANDVQENLCHVIEQAGLDLEKGDHTQLYAAIIALLAGVVGTGGGEVPTTRQVFGGGVVTGGGALVADLLLSVTPATIEQATAQLLNTVVLTPANSVGMFSVEIGAGFMVVRVGVAVFMAFSGVVASNGTTILTLPDSFPNDCVGAWCSGGNAASGAQDNNPFINGQGLSNVSVYNSEDMSLAVRVLAIGH